MCITTAVTGPTEVTFEIPSANEKGRTFWRNFQKNGRKPMLENQPSENTIGALINLHKRRSAEFSPLTRVTNALDNKEFRSEPTRIKGTPLMIDDNGNAGRKPSDFGATADTFARAVRTLMLGYALVSAADAAGHEWFLLNAAMEHITTAEYNSRLYSNCNYALHNKLMGIEMSIRSEWARVCQHDPRFSLGDAAVPTSQRQFWPFASEFKTAKGNGKGGPDH